MFDGIKARRAARQARARYEMAVWERLMADNQTRLAELRAIERCTLCADMESSARRPQAKASGA